jgi:hypothetical protein
VWWYGRGVASTIRYTVPAGGANDYYLIVYTTSTSSVQYRIDVAIQLTNYITSSAFASCDLTYLEPCALTVPKNGRVLWWWPGCPP